MSANDFALIQLLKLPEWQNKLLGINSSHPQGTNPYL